MSFDERLNKSTKFLSTDYVHTNVNHLHMLYPKRILIILLSGLGFAPLLAFNLAKADVIPDQSLGSQSTTVITGTDGRTLTIGGGAQQAENLFHSFESLSISRDEQILFEHPVTVERIFGRITGGTTSIIDGVLGVSGAADLFLLNPEGISFGSNATIRSAGSLIASSANRINFSDGFSFRASADSAILSTSVPIGLGFLGNSAIQVEGNGHTVSSGNLIFPYVESFPSSGLSVSPGNTIALIGGNVSLNGGVVRAPDGRIVLGAIREGVVPLSSDSEGWIGSFDANSGLGDIVLDEFSLLDASGLTGGAIEVVGQDIEILDSSIALVASQIRGIGASQIRISGQSILIDGEISRIPSDVLVVNRPSAPIPFVPASLILDNFAEGVPGSINVDGQTISIENGGAIYSRSFGLGVPGDIEVSGNRLFVNGANSISENPSGIAVASVGNAEPAGLDVGEIRIDANLLELSRGGSITSSTFNSSDGGRIVIASDRVLISSVTEELGFPSQVSALSLQAGLNPDIGNGGRILVTTGSFEVLNGGLITTSSDNSGNAGDITINAASFVRVGGNVPSAAGTSTIESAVVEFPEELREVFGVSGIPTGDGGTVLINTPVLDVDNGSISARNEGVGAAGDIDINAQRIDVSNGSQIAASTVEGAGGNIEIDANSLLLQDSSVNTAALSDGDGGNILIDSDAIALLNSSSISANAELGSGGQVIITADALLQSPDSSISATSEVGSARDGVVEVQAPDEAPRAESEIELPAIAVPQVTAVCSGGGGQRGEFTVTGRGGLPTSPNDIQQTYSGWPPTPSPNDTAMPARSSQIAEAQGWLSNGDGTIRFTDQSTNLVNSSPQRTACVNGPASQNRTQNRNS